MKTNKEDSAFGFAAELSRSEDVYNHGLTKRELFAAMAMQGILANPEITKNHKYLNIEQSAVKFADGLITVLNEE